MHIKLQSFVLFFANVQTKSEEKLLGAEEIKETTMINCAIMSLDPSLIFMKRERQAISQRMNVNLKMAVGGWTSG